MSPHKRHHGPWVVRFKGQEWILMNGNSGALTTQALFTNGEASYAHVYENGSIMRFCAQIGTLADLEWIRPTVMEHPDLEAFERNWFGPSWNRPSIDQLEGEASP